MRDGTISSMRSCGNLGNTLNFLEAVKVHGLDHVAGFVGELVGVHGMNELYGVICKGPGLQILEHRTYTTGTKGSCRSWHN